MSRDCLSRQSGPTYINTDSSYSKTYSKSKVHSFGGKKHMLSLSLSRAWACSSTLALCRVALITSICKQARNALFCQTTRGERIMGSCGCSLWLHSHRDATDMACSSLQLWGGQREGWREGELHSEQMGGKDQNPYRGGVSDERESLDSTVRKIERVGERETVEGKTVRARGGDAVAREQRWNRNAHLVQHGGGLNLWIMSTKRSRSQRSTASRCPEPSRWKGGACRG